jgi:hypothetical protein
MRRFEITVSEAVDTTFDDRALQTDQLVDRALQTDNNVNRAYQTDGLPNRAFQTDATPPSPAGVSPAVTGEIAPLAD